MSALIQKINPISPRRCALPNLEKLEPSRSSQIPNSCQIRFQISNWLSILANLDWKIYSGMMDIANSLVWKSKFFHQINKSAIEGYFTPNLRSTIMRLNICKKFQSSSWCLRLLFSRQSIFWVGYWMIQIVGILPNARIWYPKINHVISAHTPFDDITLLSYHDYIISMW